MSTKPGELQIAQCEQAAHSPSNCQNVKCCGHADDCNYPGLPDFPFYGFSVTTRADLLPTWDGLTRELDGNAAFAITLIPLDDEGGAYPSHMSVVSGYADGASRVIETFDPLGPPDPRGGWVGDYWWLDYDHFRAGNSQFSVGGVHYHVEQSTDPGCTSEEGAALCDFKVSCTANGSPAVSGSAAPLRPLPSSAAPKLGDPPQTASREKSEKDAAADGLALVQDLGREHPESLGFKSADEAKQAQLEAGYDAEIGTFPAPNVLRLRSIPTEVQLFYTVSGENRGLITLIQKDPNKPKWRAVDYGHPRRTQLANAAAAGNQIASLVYLPSLDRYLVRRKKDRKLSPIDGVQGLAPGTFYSQDEIARALGPR